MKFESITPKQLDANLSRFLKEQPDVADMADRDAWDSLAEESRMCEAIATEAQALLPTAARHGTLKVRRLFASIFCSGLRYGWHLRRMLAEESQLNGLLSEGEVQQLRREIAERS